MVWIPRDEQEIDDVKSLFAQQQWQSDIGGGGEPGLQSTFLCVFTQTTEIFLKLAIRQHFNVAV